MKNEKLGIGLLQGGLILEPLAKETLGGERRGSHLFNVGFTKERLSHPRARQRMTDEHGAPPRVPRPR
jgi:hypothetical protein